MYNTGWVKSRRPLDWFFTFMVEILQGYWQILDRSGKKFILLSPLVLASLQYSYPYVDQEFIMDAVWARRFPKFKLIEANINLFRW